MFETTGFVCVATAMGGFHWRVASPCSHFMRAIAGAGEWRGAVPPLPVPAHPAPGLPPVCTAG